VTVDDILKAEISEGEYKRILGYLQMKVDARTNDEKYGITDDGNEIKKSFCSAFTALHDLATGNKVLVDKIDADRLNEIKSIPFDILSNPNRVAILRERQRTFSEVRRIVEEMKQQGVFSGNPEAPDFGSLRHTWDDDTLSELSRRLDDLEGK